MLRSDKTLNIMLKQVAEDDIILFPNRIFIEAANAGNIEAGFMSW